MALYPCSLCDKRYRGAAMYIYMALVRAGYAGRRRLRLCPTCAQDVYSGIRLSYTLVAEGDATESEFQADLSRCSWSDTPDPEWTAFADCYPKGGLESHWIAAVCSDCLASAFYKRVSIPIQPSNGQ